jgi:hypothetical protein
MKRFVPGYIWQQRDRESYKNIVPGLHCIWHQRNRESKKKNCPWLTLYLASEGQGIIKPLSLAYTVSGIRDIKVHIIRHRNLASE